MGTPKSHIIVANGWRYGVGLPCRLFQPTTTVNGKLHYTACYQTVFINLLKCNKMKLKIEVPKNKLLQVLVPDQIEKCEIVNYGYAGTYLMESNSKKLNAWKMKIPNGNYEVIGRIKDVVIDEDLSEIETDKNFILRCL